MGALLTTVISVTIALGVIGGIFVGLNLAVSKLPQRVEERVRPVLFIGPAMVFGHIAAKHAAEVSASV